MAFRNTGLLFIILFLAACGGGGGGDSSYGGGGAGGGGSTGCSPSTTNLCITVVGGKYVVQNSSSAGVSQKALTLTSEIHPDFHHPTQQTSSILRPQPVPAVNSVSSRPRRALPR